MKKIKLIRGRKYKYPKKHIPELCKVFEDFTEVARTREKFIEKIFDVFVDKENVN